MRVLSIDACASNGDSWEWNNWFNTEFSIEKSEFESIDASGNSWGGFLKWFAIILNMSQETCNNFAIIDDGYNVVLYRKSDGKPFYAIEYGSEY